MKFALVYDAFSTTMTDNVTDHRITRVYDAPSVEKVIEIILRDAEDTVAKGHSGVVMNRPSLFELKPKRGESILDTEPSWDRSHTGKLVSAITHKLNEFSKRERRAPDVRLIGFYNQPFSIAHIPRWERPC
ncbi:MAG: hypothetical protein Q7S84_00960 [bacterium]|nr:hypothetical protein [bacterium]